MVGKPLLSFFSPPKARIGRLRVNDRILLNSMLYMLIADCRWMGAPPKYGSYEIVWNRPKPEHERAYRLKNEAYKRARSCVERLFA